MRLATALLMLILASAAVAAKRDVRDVTLTRDGRYSIDEYEFGGIQLTGYLGELHETEGLERVRLTGRFTPQQEASFHEAARRAGVEAFVVEGGKEREATAEGEQP